MLISLTSSHFTVWTHGTKCLILAPWGAERGSCPSPELAALVHTLLSVHTHREVVAQHICFSEHWLGFLLVADPVMYFNELVDEHTHISWLSASFGQTIRSGATILPPPLKSPHLFIVVLSYVDIDDKSLPASGHLVVSGFPISSRAAVVHVFVSMHCCALFKELRPNGLLKCVLHARGSCASRGTGGRHHLSGKLLGQCSA